MAGASGVETIHAIRRPAHGHSQSVVRGFDQIRPSFPESLKDLIVNLSDGLTNARIYSFGWKDEKLIGLKIRQRVI